MSGRFDQAPFRVMVLIDTLALGGAERIAVELAAALDRDLFRAHVVVTKRGGPLEERLRAAGIPYTILHRRRRASARAAARALHLARQSDLVHSHLFGNNVWGALLARAAGIPLVAHEHNRVERHSRFEALLDARLVGSIAYRIVCVSEEAAHPLLEAGVDPGRFEVVPNGVPDVEHLERRAARAGLGLPADAPVVGAVASLRPEKAHDVLLRAFSLLLRSTEVRPILCVVGDGREGPRLRALARDLGIDDRVIWAGERRDAARLVTAFDVSVVCSRSEGMPLSALEAMAAGTPLVATRTGTLPDLLADGAGLLVDVGDEQGLAAAIRELLEQPRRARAIGERAREAVHERHRLDEVARRIESIYLGALEPAASGDVRAPALTRFSGGSDAEMRG